MEFYKVEALIRTISIVYNTIVKENTLLASKREYNSNWRRRYLWNEIYVVLLWGSARKDVCVYIKRGSEGRDLKGGGKKSMVGPLVKERMVGAYWGQNVVSDSQCLQVATLAIFLPFFTVLLATFLLTSLFFLLVFF